MGQLLPARAPRGSRVILLYIAVGIPGPFGFLLWGLFEGEQELQDSIQFSFTPDQLALIMAAQLQYRAFEARKRLTWYRFSCLPGGCKGLWRRCHRGFGLCGGCRVFCRVWHLIRSLAQCVVHCSCLRQGIALIIARERICQATIGA